MAASKIKSCITEINNWMASNRLKLNPSKTAVVWFASSQGLLKFENAPINIGQVMINSVMSGKSLEVILDDDLKLVKHVSNICRTCFYQIRLQQHIRRYLNFKAASTLVSSLIINHIDYCNSLLAVTPVYQTDQLQGVFNSAFCLLLRVPKFDRDLHTKVMDQLHWLRAPERVSYKLCTLVYKVLHGMASNYFAELCVSVFTEE